MDIKHKIHVILVSAAYLLSMLLKGIIKLIVFNIYYELWVIFNKKISKATPINYVWNFGIARC